MASSSRRALGALVVAAFVAVIGAGVWLAVGNGDSADGTLVDERAGAYGGVRIGDSEEDVLRTFGEPDRSAGFAPSGRSPADVAVPESIDVPGTRRPALLKYDDAAFLVSATHGVAAILVAEGGAATRAGVAIGDDLDEARRRYRVACMDVAAGETLSGDIATYPSCGTNVGRIRVWFGGDPIESITLVRRQR